MVEGAFDRRPEPEKRDPIRPKEEERDRSQSQSLRTIVMRRIDDFSTATTNTRKVMILDGLITFCTNFIKDPEIREQVRSTMKGRDLNLHNDFLHVYKAEAEDNGWDIILENEYKKILPFVRDIWYTVEGELSKQGLLPWSFPDPRQELRDRMFRRTLRAIEKFTVPGSEPAEKEPPIEEPEKAPEVTEEVSPPWVENAIPDPKEEREKKLQSLLEDPALLESEDKEEEAEDPQEALERKELEEAERVWGRDALVEAAKRSLEKRGIGDLD